MVSYFGCERLVMGLLFVGQPAEPVLERLDPPRRAAVVMTLIVIALTGLLLVTCVMLGANWVRRMARAKPRTTRRENDPQSSHSNRRLRESLHAILPPADSQDTLHGDQQSGETKVDP
jgi:hypothetical protein